MVRSAFSAALDEPLEAKPVADVTLAFDDAGSPWHTRCAVTATDRPGLLHALAAAFAVADVSVHAAQITTDGARVVDQFDLTDRRGAKLDGKAKAAVVDAVTQGGRPRKRRLPRFRRVAMV
jgi:UTP:GlnB (protein PII) uridylyltransferase